MLPFDPKKGALTREAQTHAGLNKPQWVKFYVQYSAEVSRCRPNLTPSQHYTTVEADRLLEADPGLNWPLILDDVLAEMHARVNS
jgi:hypothetical protein